MTNSTLTCEAFDVELPDYLEGTLDGQARSQVDQHLRECVRCASLLRDLENIQKEAAALPELVPSRDLWAGIEARIAAPVIPLVARPQRQKWASPAWIGIAAAVLVVTTAGVTYTLTARSLVSRSGGSLAQGSVSPSPLSLAPSTVVASAETVQHGSQPSQTVTPNESSRSPVETADLGSQAGVSVTSVSRNLVPQSSHSEALYGKEIAMLQALVSQRKTQLDSSTVAVIERNLEIIDAAIEQSKAALAKDPASLLLSQQLSHALDKKVELLRTAAMLPAST
jgi:anti-sigma factor RsiW